MSKRKSISKFGFRKDSPYKDRDHLTIDSNYIDMSQVEFPLYLVPDNDEPILAEPHSGEYYFPNSTRVVEYRLDEVLKYGGLKGPQRDLVEWTEQKWRTKSGEPSHKTGERYLPEGAIKALSSEEYQRTSQKKRADGGVGNVSKQPDAIADKVRKYRMQGGGMSRKKIDKYLNANQDLNWVQRLYDFNAPTIMLEGETEPSTHFMESADRRVYPTIVQNPDGSLQYLSDQAYNYADSTNTYIEFPTDREARKFAKKYKKGTGVLQGYQEGGPVNPATQIVGGAANPEYANLYSQGRVHTYNPNDDSFTGVELPAIEIKAAAPKSWKDFGSRYNAYLANNNKSLASALFLSPIEAALGFPQAAATYWSSPDDNKSLQPSKALGIKSAAGSIAADIALDPMNLVGIGIGKNALKGVGRVGKYFTSNRLKQLPGSGNVDDIVRLESEIATLKNQEIANENIRKNLWADYKAGKITAEEYNSKAKKLFESQGEWNNPRYDLEKQLRELKVKNDIANTPQQNILQSESQLGKNISTGGSNTKGVFELGNDYVARLSSQGYDDASRLVNYQDKITSPRVAKTLQVKEIDGKVYQVQQKATGKPLNELSQEELANIPKEHINNFWKDKAELDNLGLNIDVSGGKSNIFYDPKKGFQLIDLGIGPSTVADDIIITNPILKPKQLPSSSNVNLRLWNIFNKKKPEPFLPPSLNAEAELARANADALAFSQSPYNRAKLQKFRPGQNFEVTNTEALFQNDPIARERFARLMKEDPDFLAYGNTENWLGGAQGIYGARNFGDMNDLALVNKYNLPSKTYSAGIHETGHSRSVRLPATEKERAILDDAWKGLKEADGSPLSYLEGEAVQHELRMMLEDKFGKRVYTQKDAGEIKAALKKMIADNHPYMQNINDFDISKIIKSLNEIGLVSVVPAATIATGALQETPEYQTGGLVNPVKSFYSQYLNSPKYLERLTLMRHLDPRSVIADRKELLGTVGITNNPEESTSYRVNKHFINLGKDGSDNTTLAHEMSHVVGALGNRADSRLSIHPSRQLNVNEREALASRNLGLDEHYRNNDAQEMKADMDAFRYRLWKDKIYNPGTQDFNMDILNKAKKKYKNDELINRLFQNVKSDDSLIYLMNSIAAVDNSNMTTAKYGGSTVNAAGNYTKPEMRKRLFESIKNSDTMGTPSGKWSARKAQLLAKRYKEQGGGYKQMGGIIETEDGFYVDDVPTTFLRRGGMPCMTCGGKLPKYQEGDQLPIANRILDNLDSAEYADLYNQGRVHTYDPSSDTYISPALPPVVVTDDAPKSWGDFWSRYNKKVTDNNKGSLAQALFVAPVEATLGFPQAASTYWAGSDSNKQLDPSKALNIEDPVLGFVVDLIADPTNLAGMGILSRVGKARNLFSPSLISRLEKASKGKPENVNDIINQLKKELRQKGIIEFQKTPDLPWKETIRESVKPWGYSIKEKLKDIATYSVPLPHTRRTRAAMKNLFDERFAGNNPMATKNRYATWDMYLGRPLKDHPLYNISDLTTSKKDVVYTIKRDFINMPAVQENFNKMFNSSIFPNPDNIKKLNKGEKLKFSDIDDARSAVDQPYFGTMGGFNWEVSQLSDGNYKIIASDLWDLQPIKGYKFAKNWPNFIRNIEAGKTLGIGKPFNVKVGFVLDKDTGDIINTFGLAPAALIGAEAASKTQSTPDRKVEYLKAGSGANQNEEMRYGGRFNYAIEETPDGYYITETTN